MLQAIASLRRNRTGAACLVTVAALAVSLLGVVVPATADVEVPAKGESKSIDRIRDQGAFRAGIGLGCPWLGQDPRTSQFFGPAIEIGERIAKLLNVELKLITSTWDVMIAGLQGNQFDVTLAPLYATEKRRQVVDFVNYAQDGHCYAVLKDNDRINSLDDLNQPTVTIGVFTGSGTEHVIRTRYTKAKINSLVQPVTGATRFEDVLTRRIDVAPFDSSRAVLIAHQYPQLKIVPGGVDHCRQNPDMPTPVGMALNYGDPEFKKFLQAVVDDMREQIKASTLKYNSLEYMLPRQ